MGMKEDLRELTEKFAKPDEQIVEEVKDTIVEALAHNVDMSKIRRVLHKHGFKGDKRKLVKILKSLGVEAE